MKTVLAMLAAAALNIRRLFMIVFGFGASISAPSADTIAAFVAPARTSMPTRVWLTSR